MRELKKQEQINPPEPWDLEEPTDFAKSNDKTEGSRSNNFDNLSQQNPFSLEKVECPT